MNKSIATKAGEEVEVFETGAVRGNEAEKPRFDKIVPHLSYKSRKFSISMGTGQSKKPVDLYYADYNEASFIVERGEPINYSLPWAETDTSMIPDLMLNRVGGLFWRGAQKYSRDNWKKGMSMARTFSSMFRHMIYWWAGDTSEDHLSAVIWNATVLMWTEAQVVNHVLPDNLADCGPMKGYKRDTGKV